MRRELRARAARKAPKTVRRLGRLAGFAGPAGRRSTLSVVLQALERCLRPPAEVERFLAEQAPDVLIPDASAPDRHAHADYLRAAKRLGIHTVFPVRGWDNLTNKGLLRDAPELMLVWNETPGPGGRRAPSRTTGPHPADRRCRRATTGSAGARAAIARRSAGRSDFVPTGRSCSTCARRGSSLATTRPRSSGGWIEGCVRAGGLLAEAGFLIRPHPLNAAQWADFGSDEDGVRVWPRFGEAPHDEASRRNFFDSIFHAAAVVGINTTAQIESAIVGRPVHTLLADEFRDTQQGTLHFHYLQADEFGHLLVGQDVRGACGAVGGVAAWPTSGRSERALPPPVRASARARSFGDRS